MNMNAIAISLTHPIPNTNTICRILQQTNRLEGSTCQRNFSKGVEREGTLGWSLFNEMRESRVCFSVSSTAGKGAILGFQVFAIFVATSIPFHHRTFSSLHIAHPTTLFFLFPSSTPRLPSFVRACETIPSHKRFDIRELLGLDPLVQPGIPKHSFVVSLLLPLATCFSVRTTVSLLINLLLLSLRNVGT